MQILLAAVSACGGGGKGAVVRTSCYRHPDLASLMKPGPMKTGERMRGAHLLGWGWGASRPGASASELPKDQAWDSGSPTHGGPGTSKCGDAAKVGPLGPPHLLSPGEGMVETGNVGHDGFLIGLWGIHNIWEMAARCLLAKARAGEWAHVPTQAEASLRM